MPSYYDWPVGKIAGHTGWSEDQITGLGCPEFQWTAPREMYIDISGGLWTVGNYTDVFRDARFSIQYDRINNGLKLGTPDSYYINDPDHYGDGTWFLGHRLVPKNGESPEPPFIQTAQGVDSAHPWTIDGILGSVGWPNICTKNLHVYPGDVIWAWIYWDQQSAATGSLLGWDWTITEHQRKHSWNLADDFTMLWYTPFGPETGDEWGLSDVTGRMQNRYHYDNWVKSEPWNDGINDLYNIDAHGRRNDWTEPYQSAVFKNAGGGNIPGTVGGVEYDWPAGKIAVLTNPDDGTLASHVGPILYWQAPRDMYVNISGGIWTIGHYADIDSRRTIMRWGIDHAADGYTTGIDAYFNPDTVTVPLWTDPGNYTASNPYTFNQIFLDAEQDPNASLQGVHFLKGDRFELYFAWQDGATAQGLNGIDIQITEQWIEKPVISPATGVSVGPANVTITCATSGASIYYTTDGSEPTESSTPYNGAFVLNSPATVKARAFKTNHTPSEIASEIIAVVSFQGGIEQVKTKTNGTAVACSPAIVSAKFDTCWYLESADRSSGIKVDGALPLGLKVGKIVNVAGVINTLDGAERYIQPILVTDTGQLGSIQPLNMNNRTLGGGPSGLQPGITGSSGLNNVGLLVKTTGGVSSPTTGQFFISDGSGTSIKVLSNASPADGAQVAVTGASSCEKPGSNVLPVIRATDVQGMTPVVAYSTVGGGTNKQIWMRASSFTARSYDGSGPNFVVDPLAAPKTKSGAAYYFYRSRQGSATLPWFVEYEIPQTGTYGAPWPLTGTWSFWARVSQSSSSSNAADSDWLLVNGDPNDLSLPSPTDANWYNALKARTSPNDVTQRILNQIGVYGMYNYTFKWWQDETPTTVVHRQFNVIDGKVTFRIYGREASPTNALVDVICWANNDTFFPTDAKLATVTGW
ncbi:MAG: chitobiase/beta-hexosaminidase C-terminal domain-containing protein [Armatimonadetes bacterium]|nr:chitobiase/beta-hexosaminidase C-terminal domain-containing protein [Armatimonadota bacterium]